MMLLFILIKVSFLSREVVGQLAKIVNILGNAVQLTCTSEVPGLCTTGSWLSNKTGATLGSCIQGCKSNIGLENKFHSNETSLIATFNWNWTVDNSVLKCQCGTDTAVFELTPLQSITTTVAQLSENATTTVAPSSESATTTVAPSSDNIGPIVGGVVGTLVCAALVVLVIYIMCFKKKNCGRCLPRRKGYCPRKKPKKRDAVSNVNEGQSAAQKLMGEGDEKVPEYFHNGSPGYIAKDMEMVQPQRDFIPNSVINVSDSIAKSGRTLASQDLGYHTKVPAVEKDRSKVSISSPVESTATSAKSQRSNQFQADLKDGLSRELPSLQTGPAGIPGSKSEVNDEERRSNWEKGEIDYMGRDSFANIEKKLNESLTNTTKPLAQPLTSNPSSSVGDKGKTKAENVL